MFAAQVFLILQPQQRAIIRVWVGLAGKTKSRNAFVGKVKGPSLEEAKAKPVKAAKEIITVRDYGPIVRELRSLEARPYHVFQSFP